MPWEQAASGRTLRPATTDDIPALRWPPGVASVFPLDWPVRPLRLEAYLARRAGAWLRSWAVLGRAWNAAWEDRGGHDPELRVEAAPADSAALETVLARLNEEAGFGAARSEASLRWRYRESPRPCELLVCRRHTLPTGYLAHRVEHHPGGTAGYIPEIGWLPGDSVSLATLLRAGFGRLRDDGAEAAYVLRPLGQVLRGAASRASAGDGLPWASLPGVQRPAGFSRGPPGATATRAGGAGTRALTLRLSAEPDRR